MPRCGIAEKSAENFYYRLFTKGFTRDNSFNPNGINDSWRMGTIGFRADWGINENNAATFQGQYYSGKVSQNTTFINPTMPDLSIMRPEDANLAGGHALARWQRTSGERSNTALQIYMAAHTATNCLSGKLVRPSMWIFNSVFLCRFLLFPFNRTSSGARSRFTHV